MNKAIILPILLFSYLTLYSQNVKILVWNDDFDCIVNQSVDKSSIIDVVNQIADTLSQKFYYTTQSGTGDKLIKAPASRRLIVYVGSEISDDKISGNTAYLKTYSDDEFYYLDFYIEDPEWYSKIQINDTAILQVINQDKGPLQTKTQLANGLWYQFVVLNKKGYLLQEFSIAGNELHGYLKKYDGSNQYLAHVSKFKNGILVDTILNYNNNYLTSYTIRDSLGIKLLTSASFYPNSTKYWRYENFIIGYSFTFFEDGIISSMVKVKDYVETGFLLEFDHEGNVINKTLSLER